jgi:hypothetical protein
VQSPRGGRATRDRPPGALLATTET